MIFALAAPPDMKLGTTLHPIFASKSGSIFCKAVRIPPGATKLISECSPAILFPSIFSLVPLTRQRVATSLKQRR
jgi:hypothetical protein